MLERAQGGTRESATRLTPVVGDIAFISIRRITHA